MAKIPSALEQQEKEAMEAHKKAYPEQYEQDKKPESEVVNDEEVKDETVEDSKPEEDTKPEETETPDQVDLVSLQTEIDKLKNDLSNTQQSYKTLQGKYNAEIKADLDTLYETIENLKTENEALKSNGNNINNLPDNIKNIRDKLINDHGLDEDYIKDLDAYLDNKFKSMIEPVEKEVKSVKTVSDKDAHEIYLDRLSQKVSDWRDIKNDPDFVIFLNEKDEGTGISKYDLLADAQSKRDLNRTVFWYNKFKETKTSPDNSKEKASKSKEDLIAPAAKSKSKGVTEEIKYYLESELKKFGDDVSRGVYKNKPQELAKLEAQYNKAISDGRIIAGK